MAREVDLGSIIGPQGETGPTGKSAYQVWLAQPGNAGKTEAQYIASLKGAKEIPERQAHRDQPEQPERLDQREKKEQLERQVRRGKPGQKEIREIRSQSQKRSPPCQQ